MNLCLTVIGFPVAKGSADKGRAGDTGEKVPSEFLAPGQSIFPECIGALVSAETSSPGLNKLNYSPAGRFSRDWKV